MIIIKKTFIRQKQNIAEPFCGIVYSSVYIYIYIYIYICKYDHMYMYHTYVLFIYICIYIFVYLYLSIYLYIYVHIYIYSYVQTQPWLSRFSRHSQNEADPVKVPPQIHRCHRRSLADRKKAMT